ILRAAGEGAVPRLDHEIELLRELAVETDPRAFDDAAIERGGVLLVLSVEGPAPHADALAIQERLREPLRPEQITGLYRLPLSARRKPKQRISFRRGRQAHMFPARALAGEHVAGEIELVQALHDDDLDSGFGVIDAAAKCGIKAQVHGFTLSLADGLLGIERIVKDEDIAAKPGGRGLHAGGEHGASPGVLIVALEVLIARKGEHTAPALLVPIRLNHTAAKDAVLRAELLRVRDEHEAARGI